MIVPLLGIPAFIAATFVSSLVPSPPDFCGQPLGPTCQQGRAQISAMRMAAGATLALALRLAAFVPPARRGLLSWRALLVLAGNSAMLCAALLVLRAGL